MSEKQDNAIQASARPRPNATKTWMSYRLPVLITVIVGFVQLAFLPERIGTSWGSLCNLKSNVTYLDRAHSILAKHPLIDGHNDLLVRMRGEYGNELYDSDFQQRFENGSLAGHFDLVRTKQGGYGGAFWSAFWLCPNDIMDFSDEAYDPSMYIDNLFLAVLSYPRLSICARLLSPRHSRKSYTATT